MKCFVHQYNESIGICVNCGKGVCTSCYKLGKYGITCNSSCEEEFIWKTESSNLTNERRSQNITNNELGGSKNLGLILIICGIVFYITDSFMLASVFLSFGLIALILENKHDQKK